MALPTTLENMLLLISRDDGKGLDANLGVALNAAQWLVAHFALNAQRLAVDQLVDFLSSS